MNDRTNDIDEETATQIIEGLRNGLPPRRNVSAYSTGLEDFVASVRRHHLDRGLGAGKIRFVSGAWGSGKTHLFRLLTDEAFDAGLLVSTVELNNNDAPFNKFDLVLARIVANIAAPDSDRWGSSAAPIGQLLKSALDQHAALSGLALPEAVASLKARLFADQRIDIDVKRVVGAYWETWSADTDDSAPLDERRGLLMQWFSGEAQKTAMRREFDVQKTLSKENARTILGSFVALVQFLGFRGLLVLFDESEMSHSTMRRAALRDAHNNLLHLINEIGELPGIFMVYAAVPPFFLDPRTGIQIYGALAARIGMPGSRPPAALDRVWNLDQAPTTLDDYRKAASKIRAIHGVAYGTDRQIGAEELDRYVVEIFERHGEYEQVSKWRMVVTATVSLLDDSVEGRPLPPPAKTYSDTKGLLERLGDD